LRRAFGVINALIIMLLVATLMVAVVKFAFITQKHTGDTYIQQRAQLFMQSAVENAVMAIEGYEKNTSRPCLRFMHFSDKRFEANITVLRYYCYQGDCGCDAKNGLVKPVSTPQSDGYVLMDVVVANKNPDIKKIRLEKVTLQRP
jgi:Tfp pilus assembly protein PilX